MCFPFTHKWKAHDGSIFAAPPGHVVIVQECTVCGKFKASTPSSVFGTTLADKYVQATREAQKKDPRLRFIIGERNKPANF